jgi:hypothetical protein
MIYTVEVRRIGGSHASWMAEIQSWLDRNRIDPMSFDHSSSGPGVVFRLGFTADAHATAFAKAFRGRVEHGDDPRGGALWKSALPNGH